MAINLKEDIKPISYIKTNAAEMMKYINERKNPIVSVCPQSRLLCGQTLHFAPVLYQNGAQNACFKVVCP
jgi:hypothetical protein